MAVLRSESRVYLRNYPAGTFSLTGQHSAEHRPRRIGNRLSEAVVLNHALDIQFLDGNQAVLIHETPCRLMHKIMTTIANPLMDTRQNFVRFMAGTASLCRFCLPPSRFGECLFIPAEETWVGNKRAIRECGKLVQANVDTDRLRRSGKSICLIFTSNGKTEFFQNKQTTYPTVA